MLCGIILFALETQVNIKVRICPTSWCDIGPRNSTNDMLLIGEMTLPCKINGGLAKMKWKNVSFSYLIWILCFYFLGRKHEHTCALITLLYDERFKKKRKEKMF